MRFIIINLIISVGLPLSREEVTRVMNKFSSNNRSIRYREFMKAFSFKGKEGDGDLAKVLSDGFRLNTETRSGSQNVLKAFKEEFNRYDLKNNGQISTSELKRGLQSLKIDLTDGELRRMVRRFDRDDTGFVNYIEIIDMMQYNDDVGDGGRVESRGESRGEIRGESRGDSRGGSRGGSREGMREERREREDIRHGEVREQRRSDIGGTERLGYNREGRRDVVEGMDKGRIEEGSKVEGNYRGKGKWYTGKVTRDRRDGTFDVAYDDGESESRVDEALLRPLVGRGGGLERRELGSEKEGRNGRYEREEREERRGDRDGRSTPSYSRAEERGDRGETPAYSGGRKRTSSN